MTESPQPPIEPLSRTQVLIAMGATAVVLLIVSKLWLMLDDTSLLAVRLDPAQALLGVAVGFGITAASSLVYRLWSDYRSSANFYLAFIIQPLILPDLLWLGLLPGLSEEMLFRGVMLPALGLNWVGILFSSVCFGILHFSGSQHWSYVIWAIVVGIILGFSAVETGNLLVPIVAHVTTNLISSVFWKLQQRRSLDNEKSS